MNKLLAALLLLSVSANAVLWWQREVAKSQSVSELPGSLSSGERARIVHAASKTTELRAGPTRLADIQSTDPVALCAALRANGVSPEVIRVIIATRILQQHKADFAALEVPGEKQIWWRTTYNSPSARERNEKRMKLNEQISAEVQSIIGDIPMNPGASDPRYNFLPSDRAAALQQIEKDYAGLQRKMASSGPVSKSESVAFENEKRNDLAALLSPQELAEYDLRFSPAAQDIKFRLGAIDGTEEEYRWLYAQQPRVKDLYATAPIRSTTSPEAARARDDALARFQSDVLTQLGTERGADYLWERDQDYQSLRGAARDNLMGTDIPAKVMLLRDDIGRRSYAIATDNSLSQDQKLTGLASLAASARSQLNSLIPASAGASLASPQWLQQLDKGTAMRYDFLTGSTSSTTIRPPTPPRG